MFSLGICPQRNLSKNYFHVIVNSMSWSISAGFSTACSDSLIKTVLAYLAASICGPCIYNCINRLTLCLISWRTQHTTHSAAGSSVIHFIVFTKHDRKRKVLARRAAILTRRHLDPPPWPLRRPESTFPKRQLVSHRQSSNGASLSSCNVAG